MGGEQAKGGVAIFHLDRCTYRYRVCIVLNYIVKESIYIYILQVLPHKFSFAKTVQRKENGLKKGGAPKGGAKIKQ